MNKITYSSLSRLRGTLKKGTHVKFVRMNDPYSNLEPGDTGTVIAVDDIRTIHVSWDKSGSLGVCYGEDL